MHHPRVVGDDQCCPAQHFRRFLQRQFTTQILDVVTTLLRNDFTIASFCFAPQQNDGLLDLLADFDDVSKRQPLGLELGADGENDGFGDW